MGAFRLGGALAGQQRVELCDQACRCGRRRFDVGLSLVANALPKWAARRAFAGSTCIAARKPSSVPSLILFSIHCPTVTSKKGEMVRVLGSETFHFKNSCSGVNSAAESENLVEIFRRISLAREAWTSRNSSSSQLFSKRPPQASAKSARSNTSLLSLSLIVGTSRSRAVRSAEAARGFVRRWPHPTAVPFYRATRSPPIAHPG
jgi:hypothetical protein